MASVLMMFFNQLADMESVLGMFIGFGLVVVVPVVAILTAHQRRMAELIHKNHQSTVPLQQHASASDQKVAQLEDEIRELKELLHQQMIDQDTRASLEKRLDQDSRA